MTVLGHDIFKNYTLHKYGIFYNILGIFYKYWYSFFRNLCNHF